MKNTIKLRTNVAGEELTTDIVSKKGTGMEKYLLEDSISVKFPSDITPISEGIIHIPALSTLLPVAWLTNTKVIVDAIDQTFYNQIPNIREGYQRLYPDLEFGGDRCIIVDRIIPTTSRNSTKQNAMLFSGGIDSTATYLRHEHETPYLYSIHGTDIDVNNREGWAQAMHFISEFANEMNTASYSIQSDFKECLDTWLLYLHYGEDIGRDWWGGIQYYFALPGLCAPLAHHQGISNLYQASGYNQDRSYPEAQPYIVNEISWGNTTTKFDAEELSRQDKVQIIADAVDEQNHSITVRSCYKDELGENCCKCEKCWRTTIGLLVAGTDSRKLGFDADQELFDKIQNTFERSQITLSEPELTMWLEIQQRAADNPLTTHDEFFDWFVQFDLTQLSENGWDRVEFAAKVLRLLPYPTDKYGLEIIRKATGR